MSPANSPEKQKEKKDEIAELQAALETEAKLRSESERRLEQTRQDFRDFILTAAHDLREPLRTVSAYCELLARDNPERPLSETDQFRRYILDGTARIQSLIAAISEYATADAHSGYLLNVDMNDVFREAVDYAGSRLRDRGAAIACDALPVVRGDFDKLVKVARHLLENAAQYCEAQHCRIDVSARRDGSGWVFMVRDNGPGIDSAYHRQIFEPFRRLHGQQYSGNGLGLAFCRRALASQGGRIWIDSHAGEGSTFYFTVPAAD